MTLKQYRCDTCAPKCIEYRELQEQLKFSPSRTLTEWKEFTRIKGCASHSDFQSEREALEELLEWRKEQDTGRCYEKSDWCDLWYEEEDFIKKLRKKAGE